jgi:hypothetical protein
LFSKLIDISLPSGVVSNTLYVRASFLSAETTPVIGSSEALGVLLAGVLFVLGAGVLFAVTAGFLAASA